VVFTMHTPPGIDFEFKIVSAELAWKQVCRGQCHATRGQRRVTCCRGRASACCLPPLLWFKTLRNLRPRNTPPCNA
jgi:hypothetical protein